MPTTFWRFESHRFYKKTPREVFSLLSVGSSPVPSTLAVPRNLKSISSTNNLYRLTAFRSVLTDGAKENHLVRPASQASYPSRRSKRQELLEKLFRHRGDKWETGLLWRKYPPDLNDNYEVALRCFKSLQRRFDTDQGYAESYSKIVEGYAARGFSRRTTKEELENAPPGTVFYLPNHGVIVPNKPVRVVFDASAKYKGPSTKAHICAHKFSSPLLCGQHGY